MTLLLVAAAGLLASLFLALALGAALAVNSRIDAREAASGPVLAVPDSGVLAVTARLAPPPHRG